MKEPPKQRTRSRRDWILSCWAVLAASLSGCSSIAARIDASRNKVLRHEPYVVSAEAQALHDSLTIVDLHADSLLWKRDLLKRIRRGHVDVPRLIEGNVALQCFTVVTKSPKRLNIHENNADSDNITLLAWIQGWPPETRNSLKERALFQSGKLHEFAAGSGGKLRIIKNRADLERYLVDRKTDRRITAGLLGIEGAHALEEDLANLAQMFEAGFRYVGLTHFFDNKVAGSAHGEDQHGLTDLGREVVREMERLEMIIDLAHASSRTIEEVLEVATRPVIVSHTGVDGTTPSPRNLSDAQIKAIAARGGLIGIGYWGKAIGVASPDETFGPPSRERIVKAMQYVKGLVGVGHVALGSDFDGKVEAPFDTSELAGLTQALLDGGFTRNEVRKIMGENAIALLRRSLPDR